MSMAGDLIDQQKQDKVFQRILKREGNQNCSDCTAKSPNWVSLDFGVFICMECSGAHRHLSRSVTRVYSTQIDRWNQQNIEIMDYVGNEVANQYWEFKAPTKRIPVNASPQDRIRFITEKYIRKIYADPRGQNPVQIFIQNREKGILERPLPKKEERRKSNNNLQVINDAFNQKKFFSYNNNPNNEANNNNNNNNNKAKMNSYSSPKMKPNEDLLDLINMDDGFGNFTQAVCEQKQNTNQNQNNAFDLLDFDQNNNNKNNFQNNQNTIQLQNQNNNMYQNQNNFHNNNHNQMLNLYNNNQQQQQQNMNANNQNRYQALNQMGMYQQYQQQYYYQQQNPMNYMYNYQNHNQK